LHTSERTPIRGGSLAPYRDELRRVTPKNDGKLGRVSEYVYNESKRALSVRPSKELAVVACMDSRLDIFRILGLGEGEAHIIRNAGGVVTDDALRSLIISQRKLGTKEVVLIHHTDCGMLTFEDETFREQLAAEVGEKPAFAFHTFPDLAQDVRDGIERVRTCPFIPHRDKVRGFVFDVVTGKLEEIS
jgi:carbonic anhydrase